MEQPGQNNLRSAKFSNLLLLVGGPGHQHPQPLLHLGLEHDAVPRRGAHRRGGERAASSLRA